MNEDKSLEENYIWWNNTQPDIDNEDSKKDFLPTPKPTIFEKIKTGKPFGLLKYIEDKLNKINLLSLF